MVVEKEVPKKTLVTIADSTKAEFLFEDNEQEATQLTRKRKAPADPIPDAQVQEKASEFIPKPLQAGVIGFVSGVTSQAKAVYTHLLALLLHFFAPLENFFFLYLSLIPGIPLLSSILYSQIDLPHVLTKS